MTFRLDPKHPSLTPPDRNERLTIKVLIVDDDDAVIAEAVIGLAHNLRINVVAEGVEDGAQRRQM